MRRPKWTKEALRRSEESYHIVFDRHPGPLWVFDPVTLRVLDVNEAAIASYGYSRREFLTMTIEDLRPVEDRPALRELMENPDRGRVEAGVWRHQKKDGTIIDAQVVSNAIEFEGRPARLVLSQDVTEQGRLEEQLRQAHKLEAIGSLAGGVAHDFNNILLAIRGFSAILLKDLSNEEDREHVRQIDLAAQRAAELTRQLLAFSRQQVLRPEATGMNSVIEETLELLRRVIGDNVEIVCQLEPTLETILVDRSQLGQVILNLAVNARDAMPEGGTLAIRTSNVDLDKADVAQHEGVSPGRYALAQVADSGCGMDDETAGRIFDPYFTTKREGTGLGLSTVYGIVKQSGGHIWVHSEPGIGTTFRLYFPSTQEAIAPAAAPVEVSSLEGDETILVVEDAEIILPLLVEVLESYGYQVLAAANANEALELTQSHPTIDLLLTDVVLPGLNGRELAERITADRPGLRVLFSSGYPADTIIRQRIAEGHAAFIQKPYLPDELAGTIRQILD